MTKLHFEREQLLRELRARAEVRTEHLRRARETQMQLLASAQADAIPGYAIAAAEFWLERWHGTPHPTRGRKRNSCVTTTPSMSATANSGFCLST